MKQSEFDKYREICEADRIEARLEQISEQLNTLLKIMSLNRADSPIIPPDMCYRAAKITEDVLELSGDILKVISDAKYSFGCEYWGAIPDMDAIKLMGAVADAGIKYIQECAEKAVKEKKGEQ